MTTLKVYCDEEYYEEMELLLFELEFNEKPWFNLVTMTCGWEVHRYEVKEDFGKWHIITQCAPLV